MTKFIKIFFFAFLLYRFLFAQNGLSQPYLSVIKAQDDYTVDNITVSNGLYNNYIFDVLQDHLGFLWLASDIGLQKYDGYTFALYTPDSSSVTSGKALKLYEDKKGNLWIQMKESLIRYRREHDEFVKYFFVDEKNDTIPYQVTAMAEDLDSALWIWFQDKGLFKVNRGKKTFIPHAKVNKWFQAIKNPIVLKEGSQKGIYEAQIKFPAGHFGMNLQYKFAIKRKNGSLEWEPNPNPDDPKGWGNRSLILSGETINLPAALFNSKIKTSTKSVKSIKSIKKINSKPTFVNFKLDVSNLDNPLLKGEEIQLKGDKFPLMWNENIIVNSMVFDRKNNLWIVLDSGGLFKFNLETGEHKDFFANNVIKESFGNNYINTAIRDKDGELWFGTSSGLSGYYPDKDLFENYFIDPSNPLNNINHIYRIKDDGQGNIWTISNNVKGVGCFNIFKKQFTHYSRGLDAWISSVTTDRSGIVWLGNWYQGVYKFDPASKKFSTFSIEKDGKDILDGKLILAVFEDQNGEIWFGGDLDGLYRYNRQTGKISVYKIESGNFDNSVENYILNIFQDSNSRFWIGTQGGLCSFNPETSSFKHINQPGSLYQGLGRVSKILEDTKGVLWLTTMNGLLVKLNPTTLSTEYFTLNDKQIMFRDFIADRRGFLWIGSAVEGGEGAVLKFNLRSEKLSFVKQLEKFNIISLCYEDGILWCGTNGSGLIRYDTKTDTKTLLNTENGLISNAIQGLEKDDAGNLWISSPLGLTRFNPKTNAFNHYFKEDGFFTDNFTYTAHSKSENGEMIFGSLHGVVTFYPDSIKSSTYAPPIVLTDLKIRNESVRVGGNSPLKKHISVSEGIKLAHDQNDITFAFASLDFKHSERIKYSFYLENFEEGWRKPGFERTAYYTNLDPGEYVFRVKGTNSDGIWNEKVASVKIIILPPWWATWWAYSIYTCVLLGLLYFLRRYELNRQNLKHKWELERVETEKYQEIDRVKSRFFANISHEFRTPLTLIKGPVQQMLSGEFTGNIKKQYRMILRNTNRLMHLINQLLDLSKLDSGQIQLRASPENIVPLVNGLTQSFESLAKQRNIQLAFHSSVNEIIVYIDRDKFEKIIINLLSNALKFTPEEGVVSVKVNSALDKISGDNDFAVIEITNSGEGITSDQLHKIFDRFYQADDSLVRKYEGTGIGLTLTKELVELHHGEISVVSEPGKETTFTVHLPIGKNHLLPEEIIDSPEEILSEIKIDWDIIESEFSSGSKTKSVTHQVNNSSTLLIVEDNADMRSYMHESLELNYKIIEAENGEDGIQQSLNYSPDMIISDVMMPKMDGFQFCSKIKTDERTSHIPVILLTAKASGESRIEGLETGADDYLTKPFDTRELKIRINNLIKQRRILQEKFRKEITVSPGDITVTSIDEQVVQRAIDIVEKYINDPEFDTSKMAGEVGVSRTLLNTKLKALTGLSTGEFIRTIRLKRAAQLLQKGFGNVTQVAYEVGFKSLSYFAKAFREQFGQSPSHFFSQDKNNSNN